MPAEDTIIAISSPIGNSLRGIIRLSGPDAFRLIRASFNRRLPSSGWQSITGMLKINGPEGHPVGSSKVPVTLYLMKAPRSYTKEDVVEIHTIGSTALLQLVLQHFVKDGTRLAQPGEFTRRAFLNGRIGLAQAEAVLNVITAHNAREHQLAVTSLEGHFAKQVKTIQQELVGLIGQMEIGLDFSDQLEPVRTLETESPKAVIGSYPVPQAGNIEVIPAVQVKATLQAIYDKIASLLKSSHRSQVHKDGVICVICGKPNVGKSSLFNRLVRDRKNIVDATPGTTRDYIEGIWEYRSQRIRIFDTAGLGERSGEITEIADRKTKDALQEADIYLFVVDGHQGISKQDSAAVEACRLQPTIPGSNSLPLKLPEYKDIYRRLDPAKTIVVINKIDLGMIFSGSAFSASLRCNVSARTGKGITGLKTAIYELVSTSLPERSYSAGLINLRQRVSLNYALDAFRRARQSVRTGLSYEFVILDLKQALDAMGEIVGTTATEDILDNIFNRFCIGK